MTFKTMQQRIAERQAQHPGNSQGQSQTTAKERRIIYRNEYGEAVAAILVKAHNHRTLMVRNGNGSFYIDRDQVLPDDTPVVVRSRQIKGVTAETIRLRREDAARAYGHIATRNLLKQEAQRSAKLATSAAGFEQKIVNDFYLGRTGTGNVPPVEASS